MKWEYKFVNDQRYDDNGLGHYYNVELDEDALNDLGQEGWEMITAKLSDEGVMVAVFKRECV